MILLFGSLDCEKCNAVKTYLLNNKCVFQFIDANANENQDIADSYNVDVLPHLVYLDDNKAIIDQYIGDDCLKLIV